MKNEKSFIMLPKSIIDEKNLIYNAEIFLVFCYLIKNMKYNAEKYKDIQLEKGELAITIFQISRDLNLSNQKVKTIMKILYKLDFFDSINIKNKFTKITIREHEKYLKCSHEGFIKIPKTILENKDIIWHPRKFLIFCYLIFEMNLTKTNYNNIEINCGELNTTLKKIAEDLHISTKSVYTTLQKLTNAGLIFTKSSTNQFTKITICNYAIYQKGFDK
jgi:uncharacterized protein YerC